MRQMAKWLAVIGLNHFDLWSTGSLNMSYLTSCHLIQTALTNSLCEEKGRQKDMAQQEKEEEKVKKVVRVAQAGAWLWKCHC